jgi:hypothetical protein
MGILISDGSTFYVHDYFIKVRNEIISMKSPEPIINPVIYLPLITSTPKVCTTVSSTAEIVDTSVASDDRLRKWKITYSTIKDLDCGRMKAYDGSIELRKKDNFLILNNAKSNQIGCRFMKSKDQFHIGAKLFFPLHIVRMGKEIVSNMATSVQDVTSSPPARDISPASFDNHASPSIQNVTGDPNSAVHDSIILGLDFSYGKNFAKDVKRKFNSDVHPSDKSVHFIMTVSFGRSSFKMTEDLVSIALEAITGGYCGELKVTIVCDRVFSFCVSNKSVGFHILKLRQFSCPQFKCFFHL